MCSGVLPCELPHNFAAEHDWALAQAGPEAAPEQQRALRLQERQSVYDRLTTGESVLARKTG